MSTTQEFTRKIQKAQGQTLDTARAAQDVMVEAMTTWTVMAHAVPGFDKFVGQLPDFTEVIDTHFDFAGQVLASQRDFAGRVAAVTDSKTPAPAATKAAPKAITSAPAKKPAVRKPATTAKKAPARTVTAK